MIPRHGLLLEGRGAKEIASRLGLSLHTIHSYTKELYKWVGVGGRSELLARRLVDGARPPVVLPPGYARAGFV